MKLSNEYLAGLFDGRGHVARLPMGWRIGIRVAGDLPKKLQRKFGGTCFIYLGKYWWRLQGDGAHRFLKQILPHLKVTKKEVENALRCWHQRE